MKKRIIVKKSEDVLPVISSTTGKKQEYLPSTSLDAACCVTKKRVATIGLVNETACHAKAKKLPDNILSSGDPMITHDLISNLDWFKKLEEGLDKREEEIDKQHKHNNDRIKKIKETHDEIEERLAALEEKLNPPAPLPSSGAEQRQSGAKLSTAKARPRGKGARSGKVRVIKNPKDVLPVISYIAGKKQEYLLSISLDKARNVIRKRVVTIGLVSQTLVHAREVFAGAISDRAEAVILAHNHVTGEANPSSEDMAMTKAMVDAGEILGITVLDHVIIAKKGYLSFKETGLI